MRHFILWISLMGMVNLIAADFYWVGTTTAWSTAGNWRLGSTSGSTPASAPTANDNVFITAGTVNPQLPSTTLTINGLTINTSKSLDVNGSAGFNVNGSVNLQSGSIVNSSSTVTATININNTDMTIGTAAGNLGFTVGAAAPNDKINLNITTAKFRNYGSFNCYANIVLTYKVNTTTPADNFINVLGTNNYRGTFVLNINANTVSTAFGQSAGTDTFWKAVTINKYSSNDFSLGITDDNYRAVFEAKLTLNGQSAGLSNLTLGNQCNAIITLKQGLDLDFKSLTHIILGRFNGTKQPIINITGGNLTTLALTGTYTTGNLEIYGTTVSTGTTSLSLGTIGIITTDKATVFGGATTLTCNSSNINATTFNSTAAITTSTAALKIANFTAVTFKGAVSLTTPPFNSSTTLGVAHAVPIVFQGNLTVSQSSPITGYANANVNGFKYALFNGPTGNQIYTSNSNVPFYRVDVNKNSGDLQLNSQLFMNYLTELSTFDTLKVNLWKGKIVGSESNRLIIYRSNYAIKGYNNNSYIAAGLLFKSTDATNTALTKFVPVGSATNYAPIEIKSNAGSNNLLAVTYFNSNPQTVNSNFTGGALDVSNCEYWKIVELDANLAPLPVANLFDLDKVSLIYTIPKCTKASQTNHAVGYTYKNGAVYTPWEKLTTTFVANGNSATNTFIAGQIEPSAKILKQQAEMLVTFSYRSVLIVNTVDVYNNPCTLTTGTDGVYNFNSGATGTNAGIVKVHPENNTDVPLNINSVASTASAYNVIIRIDAGASPFSVWDAVSGNPINTDNYSINNTTVTFRNSEVIPAIEQYTTNLAADGVTLPSGITTFTITTPVGIIPTKLDVYNGATLVGTITGAGTTPNSALSVGSISAAGSYRFVLAVKDLANQPLSITGYFIK